MAHGKKYNDASRRYDKLALHGMVEAVEIVKNLASATFDETIEVAIQLGVDPRKPDQQVRGTVSLPAGTGKTARVAVFAQGDFAAEARAAGADYVGAGRLQVTLAHARDRQLAAGPGHQGRPQPSPSRRRGGCVLAGPLPSSPQPISARRRRRHP